VLTILRESGIIFFWIAALLPQFEASKYAAELNVVEYDLATTTVVRFYFKDFLFILNSI